MRALGERAIEAIEGLTQALREAMAVVSHVSWLKMVAESRSRWKRAVLKGEAVLVEHYHVTGSKR